MLVFITYIISTKIAYSKGKELYSNNDIILPDLGFAIIKNLTGELWLYKFKEILFASYIILFFILIYGNSKALYEFILTCGIILLLKNFLFISTILPDPSQKCSLFSLSNFMKGSCYDLVISSHSTILFVSFLVMFYNNIFNIYTLIISIIVILTIIYLIIALRQHYTLDIINALGYSFFVYYFVSKAIVNNII